MQDNILQFDNSAKRYVALAEKKLSMKRYEEGISYLFCALKKEYSAEILKKLAKTFSEMEMYEQSNKYWIKYLDMANEKDFGDAYEGMGINFFYLDNFFLAGYYLDKKVAKDGLIKREDLAEEIIEYFSETPDKKSLYKIVYPYHLADFSDEIKVGKSYIASGHLEDAIEVLNSVPKGAKEFYQAQDELSLACFLKGDIDTAIDVNRKLLKEDGEKISYLCNLSSFYNVKGDKDKSRYYYDRAIAKEKGDEDEEYKLATCSLEQREHIRAIKYLDKILEDRPYELNLKLLLGIALINASCYERAEKLFLSLHTVCPDNPMYEFYLKMASSLLEGEQKYDKFLPLAYEDDLPKQERQKRKKRIENYLNLRIYNFKKKLSTEEFYYDLRWAYMRGNEECAKPLAFLLIAVQDERANKLITEVLTDSELRDYMKGGLLFSMIVQGYKGRVGISCGNFYNRLKIAKLGFENDEKYVYLFLAYTILMTKLAFLEIDNFDKVAFNTNKVYKKFKNSDIVSKFSKEEFASLILYLCNYVRFKNIADITRFFNVKKAKLEQLIKLFEGEKDDKNTWYR